MPPTQLKGPPFSFVIPHSGTRPFYGTQRHLGISKCEIWVQAVFPSFTPCFETTVLAYLPTLVLLLLLPVDLTILSKSAARDVSFIAKKKSFRICHASFCLLFPIGSLGLAFEMPPSLDNPAPATQPCRAGRFPPLPPGGNPSNTKIL